LERECREGGEGREFLKLFATFAHFVQFALSFIIVKSSSFLEKAINIRAAGRNIANNAEGVT